MRRLYSVCAPSGCMRTEAFNGSWVRLGQIVEHIHGLESNVCMFQSPTVPYKGNCVHRVGLQEVCSRPVSLLPLHFCSWRGSPRYHQHWHPQPQPRLGPRPLPPPIRRRLIACCGNHDNNKHHHRRRSTTTTTTRAFRACANPHNKLTKDGDLHVS